MVLGTAIFERQLGITARYDETLPSTLPVCHDLRKQGRGLPSESNHAGLPVSDVWPPNCEKLTLVI